MSFKYEESIQAGDYETALKKIFDSIEEDPTNPAHYINGGSVLYNIGKLEEANNFLLKAIELDKNNSAAYFTLGNMYFNEGKYRDARTLLLSIYDTFNDDKDINYLLAMTHVHEGNLSMSIPFFEAMYEADKEDYELVFQYALTLCQLGLLDQGEILLTNITDKYDYADAEYNLGLIKWTKYDDKDAAKRHFEKAIQIKPDHILAHNGIKNINEG